MQAQRIWHIKVRRFGQPDYEIAEIRMDGRRKPKEGEIINNVHVVNFGANGRLVNERILVKVDSFTESKSGFQSRFIVLATEQDNGNPPGHREATAKDFEQ